MKKKPSKRKQTDTTGSASMKADAKSSSPQGDTAQHPADFSHERGAHLSDSLGRLSTLLMAMSQFEAMEASALAAQSAAGVSFCAGASTPPELDVSDQAWHSAWNFSKEHEILDKHLDMYEAIVKQSAAAESADARRAACIRLLTLFHTRISNAADLLSSCCRLAALAECLGQRGVLVDGYANWLKNQAEDFCKLVRELDEYLAVDGQPGLMIQEIPSGMSPTPE